MKITKEQLKQMIKEELEAIVDENRDKHGDDVYADLRNRFLDKQKKEKAAKEKSDKEEAGENIEEMQRAVGLSQQFDNYELAGRLLDAVENKESDDRLMFLRKMAINRSNKLSRDLGEPYIDDGEKMNKVQEKEMLEQAIQELDVYLKDFMPNLTISGGTLDHMDMPMMTDRGAGEMGRPLRRPYRKFRSKMKRSTYRK